MPQLPMAVRKARAARLRAAGDRALSRFLDAQVGHTASVLIEKQEADGQVMGRSETFAPVLLPMGAVGAVVAARITGREGEALTALPFEQALSPAA
jgi:threonylcarbamoyladenosine tRNA methylthiotransferase MtaB